MGERVFMIDGVPCTEEAYEIVVQDAKDKKPKKDIERVVECAKS